MKLMMFSRGGGAPRLGVVRDDKGLWLEASAAMGRQVVIYVVADGRRDMQTVLARRLLRGGGERS